jgi:FAD/FMN-containing dehydrogenase
MGGGPRPPAARALDDFRRSLHGGLLTPADPAYPSIRRVWNGAFDRRPALIARCVDADDVSRAVAFSREQGLALAVRGGGHSFPGHSTCDDGLVIDLSHMRAVEVDSPRRVLRAQGGALLRHVDSAAAAHSLVMPAGTVSSTGLGGLALGGGFGRLARKWGLTCDQLVAAELVTADGQHRCVSTDDDPDLFWALRGGGGNFGVVTSFEFRLQPMPAQMQGGVLVFAWKHPHDLLRAFADFAATASNDFFAMVDIVPPPGGGRVAAVEVFHSGSQRTAERELTALRKIGTVLHDAVTPAPYPTLQAGIDKDYPAGRGYYLKSGYTDAMSPALIDAVVNHVDSNPPSRRIASFITLGGAVSRVQPQATAYWHRKAAFGVLLVGVWDQPADAEAPRQWVRSGWSSIEPFTDGFYVNLMAPDEDARRLRASYGDNFDRLLGIKRRYDPDNVFRLNANLRA